MTGLEDQLLVDVVKSERPDLEAKKDELVSFEAKLCRLNNTTLSFDTTAVFTNRTNMERNNEIVVEHGPCPLRKLFPRALGEPR